MGNYDEKIKIYERESGLLIQELHSGEKTQQ